jgi:hypothetical protein
VTAEPRCPCPGAAVPHNGRVTEATTTKAPAGGSASPPRNFTLTVGERVAAIVTGPPAYALRLRKIENLERALVEGLVAHGAKTGSFVDPATGELPAALGQKLAEMNQLILAHNRYYPIEKQLTSDPRTRRLLEWGTPWEPLPQVPAEALLEKARAAPR